MEFALQKTRKEAVSRISQPCDSELFTTTLCAGVCGLAGSSAPRAKPETTMISTATEVDNRIGKASR
jgi:hypothetical protein